MSNFQQFTGPAGESRAYPTYGNLIVTNSDIVDFGSNAVPNDGRWAPHAGPATVQLNASVSAAIIPQMPVTSQVYYSGVGSPPSGSYTVGETAIDSAGNEYLCTVSGTPGTWVSVQSSVYAPLASPALTGTPTINGKAAQAQKFHNTANPYAAFGQYSSGRVVCGIDAALGKLWVYNASGLGQVDALASTAFSILTLPANVTPASTAAKVVTYTPPSGANAGVKQMFLVCWNTSTSKYEVYSAPPGLKSVGPTWSSLLMSMQTNGTLIPTAIRACSTGVFVGEYTGASDISGNVKVYRSVDGITWTTVLSLASGAGGTRHIHGIYEDPFNLGTIYVTVGDFFSPYTPPYSMYKSTDGGATFTGVATTASSAWQAVSMGFTSDYIWCISDQSQGGGPFLLDRATLTPKWATLKPRYDNIAVPMGVGGRQISDAVFNSTTTVTSATASFQSRDVGCAIMGNNAIPLGSFIQSVTNSTTVVMNSAATNSSSSNTLIIGGDQFYSVAFAGAIDPATGYLYVVANDTSNFGNVAGIFVLTGPDQAFTLLRTLPLSTIGNHEVYIAGGFLWVDRYGPMPLLTAV